MLIEPRLYPSPAPGSGHTGWPEPLVLGTAGPLLWSAVAVPASGFRHRRWAPASRRCPEDYLAHSLEGRFLKRGSRTAADVWGLPGTRRLAAGREGEDWGEEARRPPGHLAPGEAAHRGGLEPGAPAPPLACSRLTLTARLAHTAQPSPRRQAALPPA